MRRHLFWDILRHFKIKKQWGLTAVIDDATNFVPFAKFYSYDGVFNNMEVLRKIIEKKGLLPVFTGTNPRCYIVDKASHF